MINDTIDPFINAYRDSLDRQRDLANQNLANTRRNQFQSIMAGANKVGMMYSNFPERSKIQYDTGTYIPAVSKVQSTYQTGLDKLRSNTVDLANQLKSINEAIADLNKTGGSGSGSGSNKAKSLTIDGTTYNVVGDPWGTEAGRVNYNLDDGYGILSIDPDIVNQK